MLKLKNFKEKFLQPPVEKRPIIENDSKSSSTLADNVILDENQVALLVQWLDQLNGQQLITVTKQKDIVIMAGGENDQAQQIFINHDDVAVYMEAKAGSSKTVDISDIARILLKCGYVNGSSGQLSFSAQTIALDSNELKWLISIVRAAQPDVQSRETHVKLFDGENTQVLRIPYEHMIPTSDGRAVANYLFRNGHVRYDINTGTYAYRYVEPDILLDENTKSLERAGQRQLLLFHIRQVHVDKQNERIELEFLHEPTHRLALPVRWYRQALAHRFDRNYIVDVLLANGGVIDRDTFVFMNYAYSLRVPRVNTLTSSLASSTHFKSTNLSSKQKNDLIRRYIDLIIEQDGTKQDDTNQLLVLENSAGGRLLYFTPEHSQFVRENQFQRQDVVHLLATHGQIKQDESGNLLLYYNNQHIQLPPSLTTSSTASSQKMSNITRSTNERSGFGIQQTSRPNTTTTTTTCNDTEGHFRAPFTQETRAEFMKQYHITIDYMYRHGLVTWDKLSQLIKLHFVDQTLLLPINHLRSIVDPHIESSSSAVEGVLPFTSRQLSQWLLNNSYMIRNTC